MTEKWVQGEVVDVKHWTETLYSVKVSAPNVEFIAGQYTKVSLSINDQEVARPYSFVNSPNEDILEFYSVSVPNGPLSTAMQKLKEGDNINIGPKGNGFLILNEIPITENIWMLATGTAIGPYLSILKTKDSWTKFKKVVLVHAVRYEKELTYQDTIRDIKDQYGDRFIYISYVSREETSTSLRGRIPKDIGNGVLEKEANIQMNPNNTHVMICGNPAMLKDTTVELKKIGLKKHRRSSPGHITTENYW
ncbi:MAG: ferredoxin--NADP(+) reductase [Gammaproteobacteria bacterium]|jgi:ferredoxin--NADP+ reductase|nr:ferredoxin--NADP(+) reductase [Gammaproteobacteria bacterium]|tara:strand:+ start:1730 stop:2476 length:747 start_codon:yes stop_codon:yes gene_type:complete